MERNAVANRRSRPSADFLSLLQQEGPCARSRPRSWRPQGPPLPASHNDDRPVRLPQIVSSAHVISPGESRSSPGKTDEAENL